MKNNAYEHQRKKPFVFRGYYKRRLTRAALIRAFSHPGSTHAETMQIVSRYMGGSPVPPAWAQLGVRGIFGNNIARLWSRFIKARPQPNYRSTDSGRWVTPVVQTVYDFGTKLEQFRARMDRSKQIITHGMDFE